MNGLRRLKPDIPGLLPVFVLVIGLLLVSPALSSPPTAVMEAPTSPFAVADDQATGLLDLQHHYQQMNRDLAKQAAGFGDEPTAHEAIQIARLALQQRETLLQGLDLDTSFFAQQHRNLDLSRELVRTMDEDHPSKLHESVELAKKATKWQASSLDLDWVEPVPLTGYEVPSAALLELAERHDVQPDAETVERIHGLDEKPEPLRFALAQFVDAFLALDSAATIAYEDTDNQHLESLLHKDKHTARWSDEGQILEKILTQDTFSTGERLLEAGVDFSLLFPSRNQFLEAILEIDQALQSSDIPRLADCDPLQIPPIFSIDLTNCDNHYTRNYVLLLDAGGSDRYHNNAGGNGVGEECDSFRAAAALVDLGLGDDEYGDPENPRRCGVNGGGGLGTGFLLNARGNSTYDALSTATNGGGSFFGAGFLLDAVGKNTYQATTWGTNGGGENHGLGMLVDQGTQTHFRALGSGTNGDFDSGTNGGGASFGIGSIIRGEGNTSYFALERGTNGGGYNFGAGFIFSAGGDNVYEGLSRGTNGGAYGGTGFLLDLKGNDTYKSSMWGANGGTFMFGIGLLLDASGNDGYLGGDYGTNGGVRGSLLVALNLPTAGLLLDLNGDDAFIAGSIGVNGGSDGILGLGILLDGGGQDYYDDDDKSCWDCTVLPKGILGAQIDSDDVSV